MGWIPDLPDPRDYTYRHASVLPLLERLRPWPGETLPDEVDLRTDVEGEYFTPPDDQGPLNSSAAFAVLSLVEYFERRLRGRTFEGSKLFLYKVTRNLRQGRLSVLENASPTAQPGPRAQLKSPQTHSMGDSGADLRTTLKALIRFGVPPQKYWPYDVDRFDEEPSPFLYRMAKTPVRIRYFRLDQPNCDGITTWNIVKSFLAAGFPVAFGFSVPGSLTAAANVPYRPELDIIQGGQAAVAVGYRNHHFGRGGHALLIRSSWGNQWGDNGNGWLPVSHVRNQLAVDFWSLVSEDWLDSSELSSPSLIDLAHKT